MLNAIEAAPEGGTVDVHIRSFAAADGQGAADSTLAPAWLELIVADNGAGLSSDVRPRIFDPFFSTRETGLGLGLAICRRIVRLHGGDIDGRNRDGGGALFTVRLPAPVDAEQPAEADRRAATVAPLPVA
jgi:signal transduction histidine kinase